MLINSKPRVLTIEDFKYANIPERYWDVRLKNIPKEYEYKEKFFDFLSNIKKNCEKGIGLFLYGPYGHGKTACGVIALKCAISYGGSAYFVSTSEFKESLFSKELFDDGENKYSLIERIRRVDLLVVDDVGSEHESNYFTAEFEQLVRHRYGRLKPTIITSNIPPTNNNGHSFSTKYGSGLFAVIEGTFTFILVKGHNWRKNGDR